MSKIRDQGQAELISTQGVENSSKGMDVDGHEASASTPASVNKGKVVLMEIQTTPPSGVKWSSPK